MDDYRDPDDLPVDPDAEVEANATPPRTSRIFRGAVDPDADRPARIEDDDELFVDPEDSLSDQPESALYGLR
jgi:hypothetical protein